MAAYVNYAFGARWRVSVRAEYLDDKDGFNTGMAQQLKEGTVTVGFSQGIFDDNQSEFALQSVYKF